MVRPVKYNAFDWSDIEYGSAEYHRRWRRANNEHSRENQRAYNKKRYKTHPETEHARRIRYALKYPNRIKANRKVQTAVKSGKLIKRPCEVCSVVKTIAHHDDYTKPLEVKWLCELHHKERHRIVTVVE